MTTPGGIRALAAALVLALALPSGLAVVPAAAQGTPAAPTGPIRIGAGAADENPQPWTVNCSSQGPAADLVCNMSQVLVQSETGQRLVAATIYRPQQSARAVMRLNLPHGIVLPEGVNVSVDEQAAIKYVILTADQNGSYADVELTEDVVARMQSGAALKLGVVTVGQEQIEFSLSLRGFTAAFAKL